MTQTTLPPVEKTQPVSAPAEGISDRSRAERKLGWMLAGPAFFVMLAVTAYPIVQATYDSLFSLPAHRPGQQVVQRPDELLGDPHRLPVVDRARRDDVHHRRHRPGGAGPRVRAGHGDGQDAAARSARVIRAAILIPYAVITVVSAFAWQFAFDINTGFVNSWFAWLPGVAADTDWFGGQWSSLLVICLAEIWKTTPFISLLLLAGLAQVPEVLQEAAKVDGATWWQRLWRVTLPNMKAAIMVALLFRTLDAFRVFDSIFIMTAGANNTESVSFLAYRQTISRLEIGLGSAVSVLLFLCVMLLAALFIKGFKVDLSSARGE